MTTKSSWAANRRRLRLGCRRVFLAELDLDPDRVVGDVRLLRATVPLEVDDLVLDQQVQVIVDVRQIHDDLEPDDMDAAKDKIRAPRSTSSTPRGSVVTPITFMSYLVIAHI